MRILYDTIMVLIYIAYFTAALNSFINIIGNVNLTDNVLIKRFVKGVFNERPSLQRYTKTWDVKTMLPFNAEKIEYTLIESSSKLSIFLTEYRAKMLNFAFNQTS